MNFISANVQYIMAISFSHKAISNIYIRYFLTVKQMIRLWYIYFMWFIRCGECATTAVPFHIARADTWRKYHPKSEVKLWGRKVLPSRLEYSIVIWDLKAFRCFVCAFYKSKQEQNCSITTVPTCLILIACGYIEQLNTKQTHVACSICLWIGTTIKIKKIHRTKDAMGFVLKSHLFIPCLYSNTEKDV